MIPEVRGLDSEMDEPKYAHLELERRWLVDRAARPSIDGLPMTLIEDRYIEGTRMRLRRMSPLTVGEAKWKLTKKYECNDPAARPIVTAYLTEAEHGVFAALPARTLRKRRFHVLVEGQYWSLDVFEGGLDGLELVEIEATDEAELVALVPPAWAAREVTHDPRYQCASLANTNALPE